MTEGQPPPQLKISKKPVIQARVEIQREELTKRDGFQGLSPEVVNRIARDRVAGKILRDRLKARSMTDSLTGLLNRRGFEERAGIEIRRMERLTRQLREKGGVGEISEHRNLLVWMDVNNLKTINDEQGHTAGDKYLRDIANLLRKTTERPTDVIARFGGDEYAVLLTDVELQGAEGWWKKTNKLFMQNGVNISGGIVDVGPHGLGKALELADEALYIAKVVSKEKGENLILSHEEAARIARERKLEVKKQHGEI